MKACFSLAIPKGTVFQGTYLSEVPNYKECEKIETGSNDSF